jgi:hypothetical protein
VKPRTGMALIRIIFIPVFGMIAMGLEDDIHVSAMMSLCMAATCRLCGRSSRMFKLSRHLRDTEKASRLRDTEKAGRLHCLVCLKILMF